MTPTELRELDIWIAENVMGEKTEHTLLQGVDYQFCKYCDLTYGYGPTDLSSQSKPCAKPYSSDMTEAWEVAEKEDMFRNAVLRKNSGGQWEVSRDLITFSRADTAPLAICLAAKKAFKFR